MEYPRISSNWKISANRVGKSLACAMPGRGSRYAEATHQRPGRRAEALQQRSCSAIVG
ncbi:hypothetical protein BURMUCF2_A0060 [Burkholderia multivorans CF2]|nr:hypothetical protein BURMUCF2_A0060 [Burkholderia multivorans CF2]